MKQLSILHVTFLESSSPNIRSWFTISNINGDTLNYPYDNGGHFSNSVLKAGWVLQKQGFNIIGSCGDFIITDTFKPFEIPAIEQIKPTISSTFGGMGMGTF